MTSLSAKPKDMVAFQMEENGIFRIVFNGAISFDSIMSFLDDFRVLENLPNELILLYDFTNAEFDLDPVKIRIISDKAMAVTINYDQIRTAFLVSEPKATAYTMLFSMMISNEKTNREIFSTIQAAEEWLLGGR